MSGTGHPFHRPAKFRVLIVEDEALVALEMHIVLASAGFDIVGVTSNLAGAIRLASTVSPQLAIVDVNLANGDSGVDVAADLKTLGIPSLFASGNCPTGPEKLIAIGCLQKPFDDQSLMRAVQTARASIELGARSTAKEWRGS